MPDIETIVAAFTEDQVTRLSGLSISQLRYWDRTGFFTPSHTDDRRVFPFSRIYSFKDVVALKTLGLLRHRHMIPLQHLRKVARKLSHLASNLWSGTTLYVLGKRIIFHEPGTGLPQEVVSGQYVLGIPLTAVIEDVQDDMDKLRRREQFQIGRIERHRHVSHNAEVIAGTRIPVATIQRFVEDGFTAAEIIKEYPSLTEADVEAAIRHREAGLAA